MSQQKQSQQKTQLKLMYFNGRGTAELTRLCFVAAGVKFEDFRVPFEEWGTYKQAMPLKSMPVLEMGGKMYCQGNALARWICRTHSGMYGKDDLQRLKIDEIHESALECYTKCLNLVFEKDEKKKTDQLAAYRTEEDKLPKFLEYFEKQITWDDKKKDVKEYLVGNELTLADLALFNFLDNFEGLTGAELKNEKLKKFCEYVKQKNPKIAAWVKERQVTPF